MIEFMMFLFYGLVMIGFYRADNDQSVYTVLLAAIWPFWIGYALALFLRDYGAQKPAKGTIIWQRKDNDKNNR